MVGLLMAPERLPSCFSWDEGREDPVRVHAMPPRPPGQRLRDMRGALARAIAARSAAHRARSAAAW